MGNVYEEIRSILKEVPEGEPESVPSKRAPVLPVAAKQMMELTERVMESWNQAYGAFVDARHAAYDIAKTLGIPTRVSKRAKTTVDIRNDHENALVGTMQWIADHFRKDYQNEVVKRGADLKADARAVAEAADNAESLSDPSIKEVAQRFVEAYLPWRTAIGDHLYRPVKGIIRRAEEVNARFLPPDERPGREREGGTRDDYKGSTLTSAQEVAAAARKFNHAIDIFTRLSEPTIGEIEKMADYAVELAKDIPPENRQPVPEPSPEEPAEMSEARPVGRPPKRKRWLRLAWDDDPEMGGSI